MPLYRIRLSIEVEYSELCTKFNKISTRLTFNTSLSLLVSDSVVISVIDMIFLIIRVKQNGSEKKI